MADVDFFHSLENLPTEDQRLFSLFGRGKAVELPHLLIHHAFEAIASVHPNAEAVRQHDGLSITYGELDKRANILANHLKTAHGISKGDRVLLVVSRSIEMVVFIFAVLKAGGQYVPVDGGVAPIETLSHQITDSGAPLVLCLPKHQTKVEQSIASAQAHDVKTLSLDSNSQLWAEGDARNPGVDVSPQDGAYVIYTSGTTGKPNPNTNLYILDEDENPARIGEPGLMWVGGAGVSRGYLNLPELTATRFKPDKFTGRGMMFNTGDIGSWFPDGTLATEGRKDDQVKINGFRVELDGVSRAIEAHPDVIKACALHVDGKLWGFYSSHAPIPEEDLVSYVGKRQPYYAVPAVWRHLSEIPLTPNGKLHKRALLYIATSVDCVVEHSSDGKGDDDEKLPEPKRSIIPGWHWLRYSALSAYRKLFIAIMFVNIAAFAIMFWESLSSDFRIPLSRLSTTVSANLLASVLLRQDHVVNFIFWLATRPGSSAPLFIRRRLAHVYHYGGVHSGCSVAASLWWLVFTTYVTLDMANPPPPPTNSLRPGPVIVALTYLILLLLIAILIMAHPTLRAKLHNQFECTHRFAGWTALALVWAHIVVVTAASSPPIAVALAKSPKLYLLLLTTLSIALPWIRLRRVPVIAEPLSAHAVRLHFPTLPTPGPFASHGIRITDRPLVEWHAFAAIPPSTSPVNSMEPQPESGRGLSILVSRAGDWTGRIIGNPPTSVYTRGVPASGVLAIAPLFKKMVLVATGSGIGPCLPVIMQRAIPVRIIWSTKKTYGREIVDAVRAADEDAVVWDSTERKARPDLVALAYRAWRESGAECVAIVSNKETTQRVVFELERRGVLAFGPIWDS